MAPGTPNFILLLVILIYTSPPIFIKVIFSREYVVGLSTGCLQFNKTRQIKEQVLQGDLDPASF